MTLSIDDELAEKMEEMKEVNWSQVARESFASYIATRKEPELSPIIKKLEKERSQQYAKGFDRAVTYASEKPYEDMEEIFISFDREQIG